MGRDFRRRRQSAGIIHRSPRRKDPRNRQLKPDEQKENAASSSPSSLRHVALQKNTYTQPRDEIQVLLSRFSHFGISYFSTETPETTFQRSRLSDLCFATVKNVQRFYTEKV